MFNRQSVFFGGDTVTNTNIKVNAVSGGIVKNHRDSFFLRFNLKGTLAGALLSSEPCRLTEWTYAEREKMSAWDAEKKKRIPVEVLQLVLVGDMEVVAEVIDLPEEAQKNA